MIFDRPLFTQTYETPGSFRPVPSSAYLYGLFEDRSSHKRDWQSADAVEEIRITEIERHAISTSDGGATVSLRNQDALRAFFDTISASHVYLDITGLSHHVWAPLLKVGLQSGRKITVLYVEPATYRYSASPRKGELFDLSDSIEGIAPLPLFASLDAGDERNQCFVPLLGFEGTRFAFLLEQVEPLGGKIFPVVGVPGFQIEYPFHSYLGNEHHLSETRAWMNIRFARANCPFSLYYALQDLRKEMPDCRLKVAPIGTKPHALGAILAAIKDPQHIEIIYDHPRRKQRRTSGAARLLAYSASDFFG